MDKFSSSEKCPLLVGIVHWWPAPVGVGSVYVFHCGSQALFPICPLFINKDIICLFVTTSFVVFSSVIYNIREGSKGLEISCVCYLIFFKVVIL